MRFARCLTVWIRSLMGINTPAARVEVPTVQVDGPQAERLTPNGWVAVALTCAMCVAVASCGVSVTADDQRLISAHTANAIQFNAGVQARQDVPDFVKTWMAAEEKTWKAMEAWSRGESPNGQE